MLKPQDVTVATEILFGPKKTVTKFGAETLAVLLKPDTDYSGFLMFCATSVATWEEISRAFAAAVAATPEEPWHIFSMFGIYLHILPGLENRDDICHNPRPEFVAGCFHGLFEAGMWVGEWNKENRKTMHSMFADGLFRTVWDAVRSTRGFLEKADPCLDDRYRSELTGAIKRYLHDPLDAGSDMFPDLASPRFKGAEQLLRDVARYTEKEKRVLPQLVNMILDGFTYGLIGRMSPLGRVRLMTQTPQSYSSETALWKFTK